ncbi:imelysin family protein [Sanyastnella coralliicola]|uniref:imelysin family protein n=1 Tax=Sanyastnella coralliicola TaxID=3069118 RepID=UPI0027B9C9C9|nr:imelysin family protein [Longitalea sp. SCSIO 12813]
MNVFRLTGFLGLALVVGCGDGDQGGGCTDQFAVNYNAEATVDDGSCKYDADGPFSVDKQAIRDTYAEIVFASYQDAQEAAKALQASINDFVAAPDEDKFEACKQAWLAAREPYGQTEAYRFSNGPIDNEEGPEGYLNAWPLDEGYIDYVEGAPNSGIIHDLEIYPSLEKSLLQQLNEQGGEENVAIGYHAIEFLLWGQDDPETSTLKAGDRPHTDYVSAPNAERRAEYLVLCADLLVEHLGDMVDTWNPEGGEYYQEFMAMDVNLALQQIITGIATLSKSELAGERIFVALDNQNQEDEHSCFSDNTHRDIYLNAQGIANVFQGSYTRPNGDRIEGVGFIDLLAKVDSSLTVEAHEITAAALQNSQQIPVPFDHSLTLETTGGDGPIMKAILSLQKQGDLFIEVRNALRLEQLLGTS